MAAKPMLGLTSLIRGNHDANGLGPRNPWGRCGLLIAAVSAVVLILGVACFHLPGWETEVNVPILQRTFRVAEILDSGLFRAGPDSVMELFLDWTLDTVRATEHFGPVTSDDTLALTPLDFVLTPVASVRTGAGIGDLTGVVPSESLFVPLPGFDFELANDCRLPGIECLVLASGKLELSLANLTPVDLDRAVLTIDGIGTIDFGPLSAWETAQRRMDLAGTVLDSVMLGRLQLASTGTSGESVWVHPRDSVVLAWLVDSLQLRHGRFTLLAPTEMSSERTSESYLRSEYHVRIDSLLVSSGMAEFTVDNRFPVALDVLLSVPEVRFDTTLAIEPAGQVRFSLDLAGRGYRNPSPDSSQLTVASRVVVRHGSQTIELDSTETVTVLLTGQASALEYIEGVVFDTVWSPQFEYSVEASSPELLSRMDFLSVWLQSNAISAVGFTGLLAVEATAYSAAGESAIVCDTVPVTAGTPEQPSSSTAAIDIAPLVNVGPCRIRARARAGITGPGRAWNCSWFAGDVHIRAPLRIALESDTFTFGPWRVGVDPTKVPTLYDDIREAEIEVRLVNHIPVAMSGQLLCLSPQGETAAVALALPQPEIEPSSGVVAAASDSTILRSLGPGQLRVFTDTFDVQFRLFIPQTDLITLRAWDYLRIEHSFARLTVRRESK